MLFVPAGCFSKCQRISGESQCVPDSLLPFPRWTPGGTETGSANPLSSLPQIQLSSASPGFHLLPPVSALGPGHSPGSRAQGGGEQGQVHRAVEVLEVTLPQCRSEPLPPLLLSCHLNLSRRVCRLLCRGETLRAPFQELL